MGNIIKLRSSVYKFIGFVKRVNKIGKVLIKPILMFTTEKTNTLKLVIIYIVKILKIKVHTSTNLSLCMIPDL